MDATDAWFLGAAVLAAAVLNGIRVRYITAGCGRPLVLSWSGSTSKTRS